MTRRQVENAEFLELQKLTEPERPITYGVVKPGPEDPEAGVIFIRGGDISNGLIDETNLRTITQDVSRPYSRTILRGGEVIMSLVGNPGQVAVVPDRLAGANLARQAGLIAIRPDVHAPYVKYFLMSPRGRAELFQRTQGAVQQVINLSDLKKVKIRLPARRTQKRIADILSAYDDLIENNRRRIALLEEAARMLYREWFVHFRYPGHEHARIIDGLPEGWERRTLGNISR
ncbi:MULTISPECIES: restriction endonuclease subunit S [unclassified Bradyrhizobium]|uniref:restriction endonuclease subunit S n=1 Tax=unclassified Bradyrhizobium TaxID=2631580 RepID=UPI001BAB5C3D|nr:MULTISPECIES: restriction endonuclease subunit S [unclassified Bradyrhizobium]MBR1208928.1 restriction endonuclease subunit S [Bradyrhizobium sp. AUGA SZCCT0124]MBR1317182.1 restriction endonuclease subunit S [Bradyrhizobium sp. AUGA SZCCT0051]MBR1345435.1 restriction endonuclease subunit S [Bradyrhizobium sp. AUGA SZCCT0105]MBR1360340.1 restriction endonuclease subunit S [Bradyrhizobium sp. AUGA SZCCT0045]